MTLYASTPKPPYFAVIFSSELSEEHSGYYEMANKMEQLASEEPGFLGIESAREAIGISVSYWSDLGSIKRWKQNIEHLNAQSKGKKRWYKSYKVRIAKVERDYPL